MKHVARIRLENGKIAGYVQEDDRGVRAFVTYRQRGAHLFRRYDSWGIDASIPQLIERVLPLVKDKPKYMLVNDTEERAYYIISYKDFLVNCRRYTPPLRDENRNMLGEQLHLPRRYWTKRPYQEAVDDLRTFEERMEQRAGIAKSQVKLDRWIRI